VRLGLWLVLELGLVLVLEMWETRLAPKTATQDLEIINAVLNIAVKTACFAAAASTGHVNIAHTRTLRAVTALHSGRYCTTASTEHI